MCRSNRVCGCCPPQEQITKTSRMREALGCLSTRPTSIRPAALSFCLMILYHPCDKSSIQFPHPNKYILFDIQTVCFLCGSIGDVRAGWVSIMQLCSEFKYIASQLFKFTFPPFTTVRRYVRINCYVRRIACSKWILRSLRLICTCVIARQSAVCDWVLFWK